MTTLTINSNSKEALTFIEYARSLPFVVEKTKKTARRLKPEVEQSILRSMRGEGLSKTYNTPEEMFEALGI